MIGLLELRVKKIGPLAKPHAISYPLPPNEDSPKLYGFILAHKAMFEISVEELPRPHLKSNSREVFTSPPKFKNDLFRLFAIFRIF